MRSGEILQPHAIAFGDFLRMALAIISPSEDVIISSAGADYDARYTASYSPDDAPAASSGVLSASGTYAIDVASATQNGVGEYTLSITCVDREGRTIDPTTRENLGSTSDTETTQSDSTNTAVLAVPSIGYPGVSPVNFADVTLIGLPFDIPLTSTVSPQGSGVSGFSIEATEGDILSINARRLSGNLGVGFVVFAQPNVPVFIAGPVSAATFSTEIELPQAGSYVIGLFRMGNVPPNAESTNFQITVSLNP